MDIHDGLQLVVPRRVRISEAEKFLEMEKDWAVKYLENLEQKRKKFLYFGREISVNLQFDFFSNKTTYNFDKDKLTVNTTAENNENIETHYHNWLKEEAAKYIIPRVENLAENYGFKYNNIQIRLQKTRWGSCSRKKTLSFNSKLLYFEHQIIDYVLIHELCHLKEMNHSKNFWKLVAQYVPDYIEFEKKLR